MIAASLRFPVLVGIYLLVDTGTQIAFEATSRAIGDMPISPAFLQAVAQSPASWVAALLYFATYASWILILKYCSLGRAFPLTTLSYVTVPLASWLIFGEGVGLVPAIGIALILAGVWLIGPQEEQEAEPAAQKPATSTGVKSCADL
ncbi:EamA family transporter [Ancylobacter oerskovii]|uniref:EamA family transporter n=1 Tax=Ancylobacter oerskovii TaxID=459519 RepID=A0ABW4YZH3_9HYPH|nr:EamA family transporter [Ancylobacter oerskovii]MBS7543937.1 EamA family transporter [Ancylobacter oerskovii]